MAFPATIDQLPTPALVVELPGYSALESALLGPRLLLLQRTRDERSGDILLLALGAP